MNFKTFVYLVVNATMFCPEKLNLQYTRLNFIPKKNPGDDENSTCIVVVLISLLAFSVVLNLILLCQKLVARILKILLENGKIDSSLAVAPAVAENAPGADLYATVNKNKVQVPEQKPSASGGDAYAVVSKPPKQKKENLKPEIQTFVIESGSEYQEI